ncbi:ferrous iron transport protein B [Anaerobacillus alkalidiazotrophicus]|uniref:Ferrous iron transport protein B n=1 Tax=Anaerobacillus alkalidiazotrophicus TaxID=472963 RepID=A0A1S2M2F5_9BACI|nr:ferrous iron transport protein B [Anaerobacillus alkalidiazotrophicus]OIJ18919.1 ferrous iron transport protein B [Anaerobacillus alkalidiazotrophicus]
MNCHCTPLPLKKEPHSEWIALVGNPNVGKSVIFHALTNIYVDVSNFPGTTLDLYHGKLNNDLIIDSPGIYGFSSFNDEERVARDFIIQADRIINVINATNIERDLFLTQHLIDTGKPVVVVLNMIDEAKKQGIEIDSNKLSQKLGVPVVEVVAIKGTGIETLKKTIKTAKPGNATPLVLEQLKEVSEIEANQAEKLLLLEGDSTISEQLPVNVPSQLETIYTARRKHVDNLTLGIVQKNDTTSKIGTIIGRALIRPLYGIPFLILMLFLMYQVIGVFVAEGVIEITEDIIMGEYYEPFIVSLFTETLNISEEGILGSFLVGEFGLLTMTIIYVLGLILPLVFSFYLFLAIFEDSGYLPRLATLVDRLMQNIGLNGRAIIPMILGLGCVTMATLTTRLLGSKREKRIAIYLLGLAIPCSAQLAVIFALLAGVGTSYTILYFLVLLLILVIVGQILDAALKGEATSLLIDIPPMRVPRPVNVLKKTTIKTVHFLKEATPLFAIGAIIITALQTTGILEKISAFLRPLTVNWLGLPAEASTAFIMGIVRRDFGAAGLNDLSLTAVQTVVALLTITLFVPCIASVLIIFKERAKKEALIMWLSTFGVSFVVGGTLFKILSMAHNLSEPVQVLVTILFFVVLSLVIKFAIRVITVKGSVQGDEYKKSA